MNDERSAFGFARGGVIDAIALYPFLVVFCALVFAAGGVALGYSRPPTYTAESKLLVGNLSIQDPSAVPGAVGASKALADVYSRLIDADEVRGPVTRAEERGDGETDVTATIVPGTPLIRVIATSDSEDSAISVAQVAGRSLSRYVNRLKSPGSEVGPVVGKYRDAARAYSKELEAFDDLTRQFKGDLTSEESDQFNEARSELQTAKLKRNALGNLYERSQNIRTSQPSLSVFLTAETAADDRESTMKITGVIGLAAGLALGAALALFLTRPGRKKS